MNDPSFRRRIKQAIESRSSLEDPHLVDTAREPSDRAFLESQIRLDKAICVWRKSRLVRRNRRRSRAAFAAAAAVAVGFGSVALVGPHGRVDPLPTVEPTVTVFTPVEEPVLRPEPKPAPLEPVVAPIPKGSEQFAAATVTAERLAYALQPVGEQVGSVIQMLIDAVPGAEVLSL